MFFLARERAGTAGWMPALRSLAWSAGGIVIIVVGIVRAEGNRRELTFTAAEAEDNNRSDIVDLNLR